VTIKIEHVRPPIPFGNFEWSAIDSDTYDGAPDSPTRHQIGYGATEAEAVEHLKLLLRERNEQ
jgi:hypothetical protein